MAKVTIAQMVGFLNLQLAEKDMAQLDPKNATEDMVSAAIAAIATKKRAESVPKFTPIVNDYGQVKFAKIQCVLGSDEIDGLLAALQSPEFATWLAENAKDLRVAKVANKARVDAHLARKAAKTTTATAAA